LYREVVDNQEANYPALTVEETVEDVVAREAGY
jgi:hypothetical protein